MSLNSKIEWTDSTWNPTTGCTPVSPGCDHCYAKTLTERFHGPGSFDEVKLHPDRLDAPFRWRKPRRVFVNSMSDIFHDDVSDEFIARVWAVMAASPQHTFQILTKRHGRMRSLLSRESFARQVLDLSLEVRPIPMGSLPHGDTYPLPNVWLGVSVEDQKRADLRIPALLDTPAAVRFLSCEPLLSAVDLNGSPTAPTYWLTGRPGWGSPEITSTGVQLCPLDVGPRISWVICGGESGPGARPMHPDWARSLRDQCQNAQVPFHFKQWGSWGPAPWVVRVCDPQVGWTGTQQGLAVAKKEAEKVGATVAVQPHGHVYVPTHKPWSLERVGDVAGAMRRFPGKTAGRELDGRTWDEFPV